MNLHPHGLTQSEAYAQQMKRAMHIFLYQYTTIMVFQQANTVWLLACKGLTLPSNPSYKYPHNPKSWLHPTPSYLSALLCLPPPLLSLPLSHGFR